MNGLYLCLVIVSYVGFLMKVLRGLKPAAYASKAFPTPLSLSRYLLGLWVAVFGTSSIISM